MPSYSHLLALVFPVFGLFALGLALRRLGWLAEAAEASALRLIINLFYPCLIFRSVLGNHSLREAATVMTAPGLGFLSIVLGLLLGTWVGRHLGLGVGSGLRTFAFSVGIYNYGYIPIPLMEGLWGRESLGVLLVYNVGIEVAIWTVGLLVLSGVSAREGWRKLANPVVFSLLAALLLNALNLELPLVLLRLVDALADCAIPLGLLSAGAALDPFLHRPGDLFDPRVSLGGLLLRLGLLPLTFLAAAAWLPLSLELKRVLVVQAAMPAGMFPLVLARHYGGQPLVAAQNILASSLVAIVLIPLWLRLGLRWVGL